MRIHGDKSLAIHVRGAHLFLFLNFNCTPNPGPSENLDKMAFKALAALIVALQIVSGPCICMGTGLRFQHCLSLCQEKSDCAHTRL